MTLASRRASTSPALPDALSAPLGRTAFSRWPSLSWQSSGAYSFRSTRYSVQLIVAGILYGVKYSWLFSTLSLIAATLSTNQNIDWLYLKYFTARHIPKNFTIIQNELAIPANQVFVADSHSRPCLGFDTLLHFLLHLIHIIHISTSVIIHPEINCPKLFFPLVFCVNDYTIYCRF